MNQILRPKKCVYCHVNDGETVLIIPIGWVHIRCKDIGSRAIHLHIQQLATGKRSLEFFCGEVLRVLEEDKKGK